MSWASSGSHQIALVLRQCLPEVLRFLPSWGRLDGFPDIYHDWIGHTAREHMRYDRSMAIVKRHEALLELIRSGTYSCPGLAEALAVSLPTVSRDIVFLRRQGYGIESVRRRTGWAYRLTRTPDCQRRSLGEP